MRNSWHFLQITWLLMKFLINPLYNLTSCRCWRVPVILLRNLQFIWDKLNKNLLWIMLFEINKLNLIGIPVNIDLLLFGNETLSCDINCSIFLAVQKLSLFYVMIINVCKLVIFVMCNRFIIDLWLTLLIKNVWTSFETASCNWFIESSYHK